MPGPCSTPKGGKTKAATKAPFSQTQGVHTVRKPLRRAMKRLEARKKAFDGARPNEKVGHNAPGSMSMGRR